MASKTSTFKAKRITRSYEQTINAAPPKVFDLLCPVKEAEWLDGWDYTLLYSKSGLAEEGCVFLSRQEGEKDTINNFLTAEARRSQRLSFICLIF